MRQAWQAVITYDRTVSCYDVSMEPGSMELHEQSKHARNSQLYNLCSHLLKTSLCSVVQFNIFPFFFLASWFLSSKCLFIHSTTYLLASLLNIGCELWALGIMQRWIIYYVSEQGACPSTRAFQGCIIGARKRKPPGVDEVWKYPASECHRIWSQG